MWLTAVRHRDTERVRNGTINMKHASLIRISFPMILLLIGCGYHRGDYVARDDRVISGLIRFEKCRNEYDRSGCGSCLSFKRSLAGPETTIRYADVRSFACEGSTYRIIAAAKIIGNRYRGTDFIAGRIIEDGRVTLMEHCETRYQSTMFSTKKFEILELVVVKGDDDAHYLLSLDPARFVEFSEKYFSDCAALVGEIKTARYRHPIENPKPGFATEYEMVNPEQVRSFVRKYNEWYAHATDRQQRNGPDQN